jgi:hypothetical protein
MNTSCYEKHYFGKSRNKGTIRQIFGGISLFIVACPTLWFFMDQSELVDKLAACILSSLWFIAIFSIFIVVFLFWMYWRFAPYHDTNMMLRADGAGRWSIHMGIAVTLFPCKYARVPKNHIADGETRILQGARDNNLKGTITLESHLYGSKDQREEKIKLLKAEFENWDYKSRQRKKNLGSMNAAWLSLLRWSLFSRINKERLPTRKEQIIIKDDLTKKTPVGIIEIIIK